MISIERTIGTYKEKFSFQQQKCLLCTEEFTSAPAIKNLKLGETVYLNVTHYKVLCNHLSISKLSRILTKTNAYIFLSLTANFYSLVLLFLKLFCLTDIGSRCFFNAVLRGMLDFLLLLQFPCLGGSFKPC